MAVVNLKEVLREFNQAKKHFKKAVDLAKRSLIVGQINFPAGEKKIVKERLKKLTKVTGEPQEKEKP